MYSEEVVQNESDVKKFLKQAIRNKDYEIDIHCSRLQSLLFLWGHFMGLSEDIIEEMSLLARFHDVGKIGVPDEILFKPGPLTEEEWEQMKTHCSIGYNVAQNDSILNKIADYILSHHEKWDGSGYPLGLSGKDIPLVCRMLIIVDAYDAMTSDRPYHNALSPEAALKEIKENGGTQFDPELVEKFFVFINEQVEYY